MLNDLLYKINFLIATEKQHEVEVAARLPSAGLKLKDHPNSYSTKQDIEAALEGEVIHVTLIKTSLGFGFTIIGGDQPGELIQILHIVAGGAADQDGRLKLGDVIIRVNGISVLNYSRQKVADLFKGIYSGTEVKIEVCRGYPLPDFASDKQLPAYSNPILSDRILVSIIKGDLGFGFSLGKAI